jgi:hypothetical protein
MDSSTEYAVPLIQEKTFAGYSILKDTEKLGLQQESSPSPIVPSVGQRWASKVLDHAQKKCILSTLLISLSLLAVALRTCMAPIYSTSRILTRLIVFFVHPLQSKNPSLCTEPACIHAASEILYNLSPNYVDIDPCTDFDTFVCGGWEDRHDLRPDQGGGLIS